MFARANEMLGEIATGDIPISAKLVEGFHVAVFWNIGFGDDGEVRVAEFVGPFVGGR